MTYLNPLVWLHLCIVKLLSTTCGEQHKKPNDMKAIESISDFNTLVSQDKPVLLDFYADWCGPCQTLLPTVEKLADEYEGNVEIRKVNVDQNQALAAEFGIRSIPALFFLKDQKVVDRVQGVVPEAQLRSKLDALATA